MIFCSFYTLNSPYVNGADKLKISLEKFDLQYHIKGIESKGSWKANCAYRAIYLKEVMHFYNDNVVWLDIDCEVLQSPDILLKMPKDVEMAWYDRDGREIMLGTSYWKNCERVRVLLDRWYNSIDYKIPEISQKTFMRQFNRMNASINFNTRILPEEYCHIFDRPVKVSPVVVHNQWSRNFKFTMDKRIVSKPISLESVPECVRVPGVTKVALPVRPNGWAFDIRCTELERRLNSSTFEVRKIPPGNLAKYGRIYDLVYFPTYESMRNMGNLCRRVTGTVAGLVAFNMEESFKIFSRAKAVAVPNKTWYDQYCDKAKSLGHSTKFFLIPNGVNYEMFKPIQRDGINFVIGWVGNDRPDRASVKRIEILRNTCKKLRITLLERNYRTNQVAHIDMPRFYNSIDLYVNVSVTEGSNNCILEAGASGVPIIGTPVGNMPELANHGAILIKNDLSNLEEMILNIKYMHNNDRVVIGKSIRGGIISEYSWDAVAKLYKEMFEYCLS